MSRRTLGRAVETEGSSDVVSPPADLSAPPADATVRIGPFVAAGQRFVIDCNDASLSAALDVRLRDLRVSLVDDQGAENLTEFLVMRQPPDWLEHPWGVWRDGEACETTVSDGYVVAYVVWEIVRLALENAAPLVPVHAAAVAKGGRALILAGPSQAGKSTVAAWLTAHGWEFLTDEIALLEPRPDGGVRVHPFWRPIGLRRPGPLDGFVEALDDDVELLIPASELGVLGSVSPLAAIVFPHYEEGSDPILDPWSRAAAVRELASHLPTLAAGGHTVFHSIVEVVRSVPAFSIAIDDLTAAAEQLESLLSLPSG